jgi:hypothetical protein
MSFLSLPIIMLLFHGFSLYDSQQMVVEMEKEHTVVIFGLFWVYMHVSALNLLCVEIMSHSEIVQQTHSTT